MASPAPTATLCQLARKGWPLAVAVLLTLLLGWSALHEGRGNSPSAHGWQAHADDLRQVMPMPAPPAEECPQHAAPAPEPPLDGEGNTPCTGIAPARATLVAHIPLWRSDALRWQLHDPALRLNPGHAPPAPHAS